MSTNGNGSNGTYSYGRARVAGALALIFAAVALSLIDALSPEYEAQPLVFGLFLGTGAVLLGVEAVRKIVGP